MRGRGRICPCRECWSAGHSGQQMEALYIGRRGRGEDAISNSGFWGQLGVPRDFMKVSVARRTGHSRPATCTHTFPRPTPAIHGHATTGSFKRRADILLVEEIHPHRVWECWVERLSMVWFTNRSSSFDKFWCSSFA